MKWAQRDADMLPRDVSREDLKNIGCIVERPKLREAIESGGTIMDHPEAPWNRSRRN